VFLIGDTPNDIRAAKTNGLISIAVATGGFDFQALEKAGADFVFEDLTDTRRLLSVLEGK
jgi:phosphoglycolate phosphatase-like HAD superfamily hydrolase